MHETEKNVIELNGVKLYTDDQLLDFAIHQKQSSNVDYFGLDYGNNRMFVQFKGGSGAYLYYNVPKEMLDDAKSAESIGKFISSKIVGQYQSTKFTERLITPVPIG